MTALDTSNVLAVDLDRTLIAGDLLYISFWSAASFNPIFYLCCIKHLLQGRAALKKYLAKKSQLDPTRLKYQDFVKDYIFRWRQQGGRAVLVTAADKSLALRVAEHLQLFDEVHGSDGKLNLKGKVKASFLCDRFGIRQFAYIGDSYSDLAVWSVSSHAITVNASPKLITAVENLCKKYTHLKPKLTLS